MLEGKRKGKLSALLSTRDALTQTVRNSHCGAIVVKATHRSILTALRERAEGRQ